MGIWPQSRGGFLSNGAFAPVLLLLIGAYFTYYTLQVSSSTITTNPFDEYKSASPAETICPPQIQQECPPPPPPPPPPSPYDPKKLAFLAETRPLPHLPSLFAHMTAVVPPEWKFKFMGSPEAMHFMRSNIIIKRLEESGKLDIIPLPSNYSLSSREEISQMFTDPHLYGTLLAPAEHLLVFQPDSIFCANAPKTINDFLDWDWVGAPWSATATWGGNGGLSVRKVSKIMEVLNKNKRRHGDAELEDLWLCNRLRRLTDAHLPGADISKTFSVEGVYDESPLGFHIGWLGVHHPQLWDHENYVKHIMEYCPEVKMILGMKLDNDKPASIQKIEAEQKQKEKEQKEKEAKKLPPPPPPAAAAAKIPAAKTETPGEKQAEEVKKPVVDDDDEHLVSEKITLTGDAQADKITGSEGES